MAITAAMVKELRERTGAGMMECKKALTETDGDMEGAIELMRKSGAAKADKKAGRTAADGCVVITLSDDGKQAAVVEINSETDFVAKDDNFTQFANAVGAAVLAGQPADVEAIAALDAGGQSVEEARTALVAKVGENIQVRRFELVKTDDLLATYQHGAKIGVVVNLKGGDEELGRDIAMHIAASRPVCVDESGVPEETVSRNAKSRSTSPCKAASRATSPKKWWKVACANSWLKLPWSVSLSSRIRIRRLPSC
ncbi:MAG: translation elongation factor Ts [Thiolinea sp.]